MPAQRDPLTDREICVLRLLAQGVCVKQAARRLHLTPRTIHFHCANIRVKLGVETMLEVMFIAGRDGLLGEYTHGSPQG